jgi:hypothetical protein
VWGGNYFELPLTKQLIVWDKTIREMDLLIVKLLGLHLISQ